MLTLYADVYGYYLCGVWVYWRHTQCCSSRWCRVSRRLHVLTELMHMFRMAFASARVHVCSFTRCV